MGDYQALIGRMHCCYIYSSKACPDVRFAPDGVLLTLDNMIQSSFHSAPRFPVDNATLSLLLTIKVVY